MSDGTIKLADFGIAQAEGLNNNLTKTNELVGSVHYMAPELTNNVPASIKSDIYATGIVFFEILTGRPPFIGDTPINIAIAHVQNDFPSIRKFYSKCPKEVEEIILKATKKKPEERYENMSRFYEDILKVKNNPDILKDHRGFLARLFGFK